MDPRILDLIATVMDACTGPPGRGRGPPPAAIVRVLATLHQFLREGRPWRGLRATAGQASGSTLRRRLRAWAEAGNLLQRVHAVRVTMLRGDPDQILDRCSVRAERGGDLTGPNPTDRGKRGTKDRVAVTGEGVPVACAATAANVNDTVLFERLFLMAVAVLARIRTVCADRATTPSPPIATSAARSAPSPAWLRSTGHRRLQEWAQAVNLLQQARAVLVAMLRGGYPRCRRSCRERRITPRLARRGIESSERLGRHRWVVERTLAWLSRFRRLTIRYERRAELHQAFLTLGCALICFNQLQRFC